MLTGAPAAGSFQPIDFAASIARLNASTEPISGFAASLRTNTPTPALARSVRLPATTLPTFSSASICGPAAMTTSAASPCRTRSAMPPTVPQSNVTLWPDDASNFGTSSAITGCTPEPASTLMSAACAAALTRQHASARTKRPDILIMKSTLRAPLRCDAQQLRRRIAQHAGALGTAQAGRREDVVDRGAGPRERIVGAHHDLPRSHHLGQVAQGLRRKHDRIVIELAQVFGGLLLERHRRAAIREGDADGVRTIRIGRQIAAAVRGADLESREAVERPFVDQMRERERGLERIADRIGEPAIAVQARLELLGADRMDEDKRTELLHLRPDGMEFRIGKLPPLDAAADRHAAQAELLDAVLDLLDREVGMLERHGGEGDEAVGLRCHQLGELFVLQLDERRRDVAVRLVPVGIDAERLDVDALLVHGAQTRGRHYQALRPHLQTHHRQGLGEGAVRVDVDGLHAAAVHHHLAPPHRCALR